MKIFSVYMENSHIKKRKPKGNEEYGKHILP